MGLYFDDWTIYNMLKGHIKWLRLMLERYRQIQLSLNIKKYIFSTAIGIILGHVVCKEGIKVEISKIKVIINLKPPVNHKQIRIFLGQIGYYKKFIRHYSYITYPMEEFLRIDASFHWIEECQHSFELLKRKLVEAPILKFLDCSKKFHVHIDASRLAISAILTQPTNDATNHPNAYGSQKINRVERN